jgi:rubrerythrin
MINVQQIIEESIIYEFKTFDVYTFFSKTFKDDSQFWNVLAEEELNHVSILRTSLSFRERNTKIIDGFSINDIEMVKECIEKLEQNFENFKKSPSCKLAIKIAIEIEKSTIEDNYQRFMEKVTDDSDIYIFQTLNSEEQNHLKRIQKYFNLK